MDLQILKNQFGEALEAYLDKGQAVAQVQLAKLHEVLAFCKNDEAFQMNLLLDVIAVDYQEELPRFELVYVLYSLSHKERLRIKVRLEDSKSVPTASDLWKSADWAEREVWDMFGIKFEGHPNLKRILMFEGFEGHPLRKDYPVSKRQKIPEMEEMLSSS